MNIVDIVLKALAESIKKVGDPLGIGSALKKLAGHVRGLKPEQIAQINLDAWLVVWVLGESIVVGITKVDYPLHHHCYVGLFFWGLSYVYLLLSVD